MRFRHGERALCLAASLILFGPWLRPARAQLLGPEFIVNSYNFSAQGDPAVAADAADNFVVVWQSSNQDGAGYGIFGQRFTPPGTPVGGEFPINTYTTGTQRAPAVAADTSGSFVVTWQSSGPDGSGYGIVGRRYSSTGTPLAGEFQVNSFTTGVQSSPAMAMDSTGKFIVTWNSSGQDGSSWGVFGQRFDAAGSPLGIEFQVNAYTTGNQSGSAVAADGSGNFVVVWGSDLQDGSSYGIFGRRYDAAGLPLGGEFQINSYTTGAQLMSAVTADSAGRFVVVWASFAQDGSYGGVFGQRFSAAGSSLGSEFQVSTYTIGQQYVPAVTAVGSGSFVVAWQSKDQDGSDQGVFGQRFLPDGSRVGSEFQINSYTTYAQVRPAMAVGGSGDFVVVWSSDYQDGFGEGVFGQRLAGGIFLDGFASADACVWSAAVGGGCP